MGTLKRKQASHDFKHFSVLCETATETRRMLKEIVSVYKVLRCQKVLDLETFSLSVNP